MEITPAPTPRRPDLTVVEKVLSRKVWLLPTAHRVRTGTPLTLDAGGWRPTGPDEPAFMFATHSADGGDAVEACRSMIVDTHNPVLIPGRVKIQDVTDLGSVTFVNDPAGPYLALTKTHVLVG